MKRPPKGGLFFISAYFGCSQAFATPSRKAYVSNIARFLNGDSECPGFLLPNAAFVLALARHDADPTLFLSGIDRIDKEAQSWPEIERLKKALVAAAIGKQDVLAALRGLTMDAVIRESLASLGEAERNQQVKDTLLMLAPVIRNAPTDLSELIEDWELSDIDSLAAELAHASQTNDWNDLYSARPRTTP
ncbi:MAG: hypothetical protein E5V95_24795 [Mesorhizobium sp.]|uniref:hypothetical protein n=1 Tax=Mesorhizobium sp. TaxID=1871066 RepID=UPI00121F6CAE|nr:hypothetical protein [Mesorhizobium sp.]TIV15830.1 MAG: hypothetical protein E5V95_24795 [Mesorhizobium sp.]